MQSLIHDLRYAFRMLIKSPAFTFVAVISLAIGIGANTAIFSVANAILFRSMPFRDAANLVDVHGVGEFENRFAASYPAYQYYRDHNQTFSDLLCWGELSLSLSTGGNAEQAFGIIVSGNYFSTLGVQPALGRFFLPEEDETVGTHPVVVLSYGFWQRRFGSDPEIIGRAINLNNHQFTVAGVAPKVFTSTIAIWAPDMYVPMMMQPQVMPASDMLNARNAEWLQMTGRLKPGASIEQATADLTTLSRQLEAAYPELNQRAEGEPERDGSRDVSLVKVGSFPIRTKGVIIGFFGLLLAVVSLVLLIACANLTSLMLARATARRKEIAVRLAVGAGRFRIIRQLLTESVLLCIASGVVGILFAIWMRGLLLAFKPSIPLPIDYNFPLDGCVLSWTFGLSLLTGTVFGLLPALQASKLDLVKALKDESRSQGLRSSRLRNLFVIGQVAMSLLLLISAGLFLRAVTYAQTVYSGSEPERIQTVSFDPRILGYDEAKSRQFYRQLIDRVRAMPGVESASLAQMVLVGPSRSETSISLESRDAALATDEVPVEFNVVAPQYFQTMKIPILRGRDFSEADRTGAQSVAIIDETMARRYFAGEDAVGKHFTSGKTLFEIIGVAESGKQRILGQEPDPFVYFAFAQTEKPLFDSRMTLHVRSLMTSESVFSAIRNEVSVLDKNMPLQTTMPLTEHIRLSILPQRIVAAIAGVFGVTGLLLAAIGIYGVMSYSVAQRTHEIGVRMALGARRKDVLRMVLSQGLKITLIGVTIGLAGAFAITRLLSSLLYGVSATDPLTFIVIPCILAGVALGASFVPAHRATKVDPMIALRYE